MWLITATFQLQLRGNFWMLFRKASRKSDLILTSGGMSVGEADYIKPVVEALGHIDMWKIAVKPGKPVAKGGG